MIVSEFKPNQTVRFRRDSGEFGVDDLTIDEGTIATVTAVTADWISLEHFRDEYGLEKIAYGSDGESYTGEIYFTDFEALEIVYPISD